ncbi:MAG TPA: ABC transporter permease subunit, partial [Planctomycetota bacterium]|nr:ABC transporter permease subunit [Planctomycetota bacterium]
MKLANVMIIARKEFRDVTRDRRTLMFMMLLPIVVMPLLVTGVSRFAINQMKAKGERELTIAADPLARNQLTTLANRWLTKNALTIGVISSKLGLDTASTLDGLGRLSERAELLRSQSGDKPGEDAAMLAQMKAMEEMTPDQQQFLSDIGSVSRLLTLTEWTTLDVLPAAGDGKLAQGVTIPKDLPPALADPRVAAAITSKEKTVHAAIDVPVDSLERLIDGEDPSAGVKLTVLYDSSQSLSDEAFDRLSAFIEAISRSEMRGRLSAQSLRPGFIEPFELREANVASSSRKSQAFLGGLLPYIAILFSFFGAFYPSLDLTAGEKERFTLETLLLAPVTRLEIAA